jgi:hypothetical protein
MNSSPPPALGKLLTAVDEEGCAVTTAAPGREYPLGGGCVLTVLSPVGDYGDAYNNWSVVTRLVCGETSFLFMGDAEKDAENDIMSTGVELDSDVLKVGHHGSSTSSGKDFVAAVHGRRGHPLRRRERLRPSASGDDGASGRHGRADLPHGSRRYGRHENGRRDDCGFYRKIAGTKRKDADDGALDS